MILIKFNYFKKKIPVSKTCLSLGFLPYLKLKNILSLILLQQGFSQWRLLTSVLYSKAARALHTPWHVSTQLPFSWPPSWSAIFHSRLSFTHLLPLILLEHLLIRGVISAPVRQHIHILFHQALNTELYVANEELCGHINLLSLHHIRNICPTLKVSTEVLWTY